LSDACKEKASAFNLTLSFILGQDFDPKGFHKVITELGPAPLEIMEDQVMAWINSGITSEAGRPGSSQTLLMISMFILAVFSFVFNI
jgi:hypothetical protein